jgi:hypothetical protein
MITTTTQRFSVFAQQLAREGFRRGVPPHLDEHTERVDKSVCRRAKCGHCRRRGLLYRPFFKGRVYRVLAVCPACRRAEEF